MTEFVNDPVIQALAWALVHAMWQGAVIGLASFVAFRLVRTSPNARYAIGVAALIAMLAAPVATFVVIRSQAAAASQNVPVEPAPAAAASFAAVTDDAATRTPAGAAGVPVAPELLAGAVVAWLGGVMFFGIRLLGGWIVARRLTRRAVEPASDHLQAMARRLAERLAIRRAVTILQSSRIAVPVMVGWLEPAIVLPIAALGGLSPAQVEALLAHELAHVRRHDYLVNLLQSVVEALLFYHPAVWWLSRRVRAERELCCDDLAIGVCDRLVYATALTDLASMTPPCVALAATDGDLLSRVRRILGQADAAPALRAGALPVLVLILAAGVTVPSALASPQAPVVRPVAVPVEVVPEPVAPAVVTLQGRASVVVEPVEPVVAEFDRLRLDQTAQQSEQQRAEELKRQMEAMQRELQRVLDELELKRNVDVRERAAAQSQEAGAIEKKVREVQIESAIREYDHAKELFEKGLVSSTQLREAELAIAKAKAAGNQQAEREVALQTARAELERAKMLVERGLVSARDLEKMELQVKMLEVQSAQKVVAEEARARNAERERPREVAPEGVAVAANEPARAGDVLRIAIQGEPSLPPTYRVSEDGTIRMPFLGAIKVTGLTAAQVRDAVGKQLAAHKLGSAEQVTVAITRGPRR